MTARARGFRAPFVLGGGVALLAACSLALPYEPLYDPWAWLVWGGELADLDLDTDAGPSWKPLPVLVDAVFSIAGDAVPALWLALSRAGWIAAALLAGALAARLVFAPTLANRVAGVWARRRVRRAQGLAAVLAGIGVIVLNDPFTSWARQFAGGLSEPLLVALVLGAIHLELSRRSGLAFTLGVAAALLRPEVWPFLAVYGWAVWRSGAVSRRSLIAGGIAIPLLWLVPDLVGSGSPFTGATRARQGSGSPPVEAVEALGRSLDLVLASLWVGAAYAVYNAWRAGERTIPLLGSGALAWIAIVAVLAGAGYAGIPRFAAPAAAIGCVLGAVGIVRMLAALDGMRAGDRRRIAVAAVGVLLAAFSAQAVVRAGQIPGDLENAREYARGVDDLEALVDEIGAERIDACGAVTTSNFLAQTQLAWELERPIDRIAIRTSSAPPEGTAFLDRAAPIAAGEAVEAAGSPLGEHGLWSAYAISCANGGLTRASHARG